MKGECGIRCDRGMRDQMRKGNAGEDVKGECG